MPLLPQERTCLTASLPAAAAAALTYAIASRLASRPGRGGAAEEISS